MKDLMVLMQAAREDQRAVERRILGSILAHDLKEFQGAVLDSGLLEFEEPACQAVFRAVESLWHDHEPIDLVTLTDEMRKAGTLEQAGGLTFLTLLLESIPS